MSEAEKKPYPSLVEIHEQEDAELERAEEEIKKLKASRTAYRVFVVLLAILLLYELNEGRQWLRLFENQGGSQSPRIPRVRRAVVR